VLGSLVSVAGSRVAPLGCFVSQVSGSVSALAVPVPLLARAVSLATCDVSPGGRVIPLLAGAISSFRHVCGLTVFAVVLNVWVRLSVRSGSCHACSSAARTVRPRSVGSTGHAEEVETIGNVGGQERLGGACARSATHASRNMTASQPEGKASNLQAGSRPQARRLSNE
jgi:hypothetical protein